jgi:hypothetical protein
MPNQLLDVMTMMCNLGKLDTNEQEVVKLLEKELGKTVLAIRCYKTTKPVDLTESEINRLREVEDKLSFMKFLGFPKDIPDFTTVWYFGEQSGWRRREKTERSGRNCSDNVMRGV